MIRPVLVLLFCLIASSQASVPWWNNFITPGWRPRLSGSQYFPWPVGLPDSGYIGCFGDFNSDKYTDLFLITSNSTSSTVTVYLWDRSNFDFNPLTTASITETNIDQVAAGDFNYDGRLDLLVSGFTTPPERFVHIYLGNHVDFYSRITLPSSNSQLLVLDANGDMYLDLFGNATETNQRTIWINQGDALQWTLQVLDAEAVDSVPLSLDHPSAFVDINNDCRSDLVIFSQVNETATQMEIWLNNYGQFNLSEILPLPDNAGPVSFADFDSNGAIDMILPICSLSDNCTTVNEIQFVYNHIGAICSNTWGSESNCISPSSMCSINSYSLNTTDPNSPYTVTISRQQFIDYSAGTLASSSLLVRIGDWDRDGYPEIITTNFINGTNQMQLWQSVPCYYDSTSKTPSTCSAAATSNGLRTMQPAPSTYLQDVTTENVVLSTFFDIGDDATLDIFVFQWSHNKLGVSAFINNIDLYDSFFLKPLGLNGVCVAYCWSNEDVFPDPKPYGVNYPGGVFKFTITNNSGKNRPASGVALTQSSHLALQTPYIVFGLGSYQNYVAYFLYGVATKHNQNYQVFQGLIPNTQLAVVPYKPDRPSRWRLEQHIMPSGVTFWVILFCVLTCLILVMFISYLHYREKQIDHAEAQKRAQFFSFKAL